MRAATQVGSRRSRRFFFKFSRSTQRTSRSEEVSVTPFVLGAVTPTERRSILVVEDEDMVRSLIENVLRDLGHNVVTAAGPGEALSLLRDPGFAVDLLLTDVVMPESSGPELAKAAARDRPGMKVLYTSGFTDSGIVREGVLEPGLAFLPKPFTPMRLARKVREVLSR